MKSAILAFGLAVGGPALALAQPVAIINARIETAGPQGSIASGTLVMDQGRIVAVGPTIGVPAGAKIIDAKGQVVTPGLIQASTSLGISEIEQVPETRDDGAGQKLGAAFNPAAGINPDAPTISLARLNGVTRAFLTPVAGRSGGGAHAHDDSAFATAGGHEEDDPTLFAGQAIGINLASDQTDLVFKTNAGMVLQFGESAAAAAGGSRGASLILLKQVLADTRHFAANRAAYDKGEGRGLMVSRLDLEALVPVVQGRSPLLVRVSSANDIRQVLKLAREEKLSIILEGAEEGWRVAAELAAAKVPVIIDSQAALPSSFETLGTHLDNARVLQAAGVSVAIMGSRDYNNLRQSRMNAGTAVAHGLPYQQALQAITLVPARIWGVDQETGSLEAGKAADVVIWSGDPLEGQSYPTAVFIAGVAQPMTSRSTELAARYKPASDTSPRPAYRN
ncbi:imidazolonepropionase [Candidatus Phycosocius bacilliformis]|uniref:Imidazolonepropionase n=1 Tax=Candidatus Phycosocius bacilliformis TaxID=1445552 RepID=A0A2P2E8Y8_9PROT|nr:amidohydrolase family protein [Candidatus Phycosocius bacilliformis]GBF57532.1 imidazolonepropionase [Candidatus Phycosocius bacilliformis]